MASCPPLLAAILNASKSHDTHRESRYVEFLTEANAAINEAANANISITASFKFTNQIAAKTAVDEENSSLLEVFEFYASMQVLFLSTNDLQNKKMRFFELELLLRDFNVNPRLLTRDELKFMWKCMSVERIQQGRGEIKVLSIEDFKECLVRLAILIYNKPGMRKLVFTIGESIPSPQNMLEYFCHYLKFDDIYGIRNLLRTTGRETQGAVINFGSNQQFLIRNKEILHKENEWRKVLKRAKAMKDQLEKDKRNVMSNASLATLSVIAARERKHHNQPLSRTSKSCSALLSGSAQHHHKTLLPDRLRGMINSEAFMEALREPEAPKDYDPIRDHDNDDDDDSFCSSNPTTMDKSLAFMTDYDAEYKKILLKYCYTRPGVESSDVLHTEGPFVDLGEVNQGTACHIQIVIRNVSSDDVKFDATTEGFSHCSQVQITTHPSILVPGLMRIVNLSFTVEQQYMGFAQAIIGHILVHVVTLRGEKQSCISCPVHFITTDNATVKGALNCKALCNTHTLPELLRKHCGVAHHVNVTYGEVSAARVTASRHVPQNLHHHVKPAPAKILAEQVQQYLHTNVAHHLHHQHHDEHAADGLKANATMSTRASFSASQKYNYYSHKHQQDAYTQLTSSSPSGARVTLLDDSLQQGSFVESLASGSLS